MEQFKYCSSLLTNVGYGTIRPPSDKFTEGWGDEVMNPIDKGGKDFRRYCLLDSCTDKGLDAIAKYNNYEKEWNDEKNLFNNETLLAQKRFINFKLYAKHRDRRSYHLDQIEGGHRKVANIQANFCSPLDPERGCFSKPTSYNLAQFNQVGLKPADDINNSDITGAYNTSLKEGSNLNGFFHATTWVQVRYLNNLEISVPEYLESCRIASAGLAREKRNSATKDPFVEIAMLVSKYLSSMSNTALLNRPCLSNISYKGDNKFPGVISEKNITKNMTW